MYYVYSVEEVLCGWNSCFIFTIFFLGAQDSEYFLLLTTWMNEGWVKYAKHLIYKEGTTYLVKYGSFKICYLKINSMHMI